MHRSHSPEYAQSQNPTQPEAATMSRRSALKLMGVAMLDVALSAGIVGADYATSYLMPQKLTPVGANAASAGGVQAVTAPAATFAGPFSSDGSVTSTASSYTSANIAVTITSASLNSGLLDTSAEGKHQKYGTGISYTLADLYVSSVDCLRTAFAQDSYGVGFTERLASISSRMGAVLGVNGDSYSNNRHKNNGTIIRNGELYRAADSTEETCVLYRDGSMRIFLPGELDAQAAMDEGAWQSWVFGPSLLDDGKAKTEFLTWDYIRQSHPRTAIGYFEPGHYCLLAVDGRQSTTRGMFLPEMASLFQQLGCKLAYNLDGGSSTSMVFDGTTVDTPYRPKQEVSDGIFAVEPEGASTAGSAKGTIGTAITGGRSV